MEWYAMNTTALSPAEPPSDRFQGLLDLDPVAPRLQLVESGEYVAVVFESKLLYCYRRDDVEMERLAIAFLASSRAASKVEVARLFGRHVNTVYNIRDKAALGPEHIAMKSRGPKGRTKCTPIIYRTLEKAYSKGKSWQEAGELVLESHGVELSRTILCDVRREVLAHRREQAEKEAAAAEAQLLLPLVEAPPEAGKTESAEEPAEQAPAPPPAEESRDEEGRSESERMEEVLAATPAPEGPAEVPAGRVDELEVREGKGQAFVGAWLLMSFLHKVGLAEMVRRLFGPVSATLYGIARTVVTMWMALFFEHRTVEGCERARNHDLGHLIGTEEFPCVRTLRRKLLWLARPRVVFEMLKELARRYVDLGIVQIGVLYVDGKFIAYHGKRNSKSGYSTIRRLALPGRSEFFVNDIRGRPLFFLLQEGTPSLNLVVPRIRKEVRSIIGKKPVVWVIDRGGYSGELFRKLEDGDGVKDLFITYGRSYKAKKAKIGRGRPRRVDVTFVLGGRTRTRTCSVKETKKKIKGYGEARCILVRRKSAWTPVLTNDWESPVAVILSRIFARWRQENFFRNYNRHFSFQAMGDYKSLDPKEDPGQNPESDEDFEVKNPEVISLDKKIRKQRALVGRLQKLVGREVGKDRKSSEADATHLRKLRLASTKLKGLEETRDSLPKYVLVSSLPDSSRLCLSTARKMLLDGLKTLAYNAEDWLLDHFEGCFKDYREIHVVLREILRRPGDIEIVEGVVHVTLAPLSPPRYANAARLLCERLNATDPRTWDGRWRIRYFVKEEEGAALTEPTT